VSGADRTMELAVKVDCGQPSRYAEVTGDRNAVHIDPAAGRAAGFGGVIAHGLGILGLATSALVAAFSREAPDRLARIRARFGAPVPPGQTLTIAAAAHPAAAGHPERRWIRGADRNGRPCPARRLGCLPLTLSVDESNPVG
jgi:acyl dehydratase